MIKVLWIQKYKRIYQVKHKKLTQSRDDKTSLCVYIRFSFKKDE